MADSNEDGPEHDILGDAIERLAVAGIEPGEVPHMFISLGLELLDASCCQQHLIGELQMVHDIISTRLEQAKAGVPRDTH